MQATPATLAKRLRPIAGAAVLLLAYHLVDGRTGRSGRSSRRGRFAHR